MRMACSGVSWVLVLVVMLAGSLPGRAAPTTPFYNVWDYGAVGDGITKDTEAIRNAIVATVDTGGGTVYFPAGRYLTGSSHPRVVSSIAGQKQPGDPLAGQ